MEVSNIAPGLPDAILISQSPRYIIDYNTGLHPARLPEYVWRRMPLSKADITEFQRLFKTKTGKDLTPDQAAEYSERLTSLVQWMIDNRVPTPRKILPYGLDRSPTSFSLSLI